MSVADYLARTALRGAITVRRRAGTAKSAPVCVFDLAERLGVEVMFTGGSSFEGLFARDSTTILISSMRPVGRQAFTCAHELAHWFFDHGTRVDELDAGTADSSPEERLAHFFASYLLMPPWAVEAAFQVRGWSPDRPTPIQVYTVATQLGVGYETLVRHLRLSLGFITEATAKGLLRSSPRQVREELAGSTPSGAHLAVVDRAWTGVPVDLRVGDLVLMPADWKLDGNTLEPGLATPHGRLLAAISPGIGRIVCPSPGIAHFVRVSRSAYQGRSKFRHLEESDDD
jgi:Zn-dependent peptidase ImmA (M78 family)